MIGNGRKFIEKKGDIPWQTTPWTRVSNRSIKLTVTTENSGRRARWLQHMYKIPQQQLSSDMITIHGIIGWVRITTVHSIHQNHSHILHIAKSEWVLKVGNITAWQLVAHVEIWSTELDVATSSMYICQNPSLRNAQVHIQTEAPQLLRRFGVQRAQYLSTVAKRKVLHCSTLSNLLGVATLMTTSEIYSGFFLIWIAEC